MNNRLPQLMRGIAGVLAWPVLALVIFGGVHIFGVHAATPSTIITYQGKLLASGTPVTTTLPMKFVLYDDPTGGTARYTAAGTLPTTSTVSITPTSGLFSINLGDTVGINGNPISNAIPDTLFSTYPDLYLEVTVNGQTLTPRKRLTAAPYAIHSATAVTSTFAYTANTSTYATTASNTLLFGGLSTSSFAKLGSNETVGGSWTFSTTTNFGNLNVVGNISNVIANNYEVREIATTSVGLYPSAIAVSGRYAYVANYESDSMSVVDISNPSVPVQIATTSVGLGPIFVTVSGKYVYVNSSDGVGTGGNLSIIDVSNPYIPVRVSNLGFGTGIVNVAVSGRYAYVTVVGMSNTLSIVDISDPLEEMVSKFRGSDRFNLVVVDNGKYVGFMSRANVYAEYRKYVSTFSEE
jgi:YVTN family beta-propeller protein